MNNEIRKILEDSPLSIRWKNFGHWKKEDIKNCNDALVHHNIKINKFHGMYKISSVTASLNLVKISTLCSLERDFLLVIKMKLLYLGDKTIMKSRFEATTLN